MINYGKQTIEKDDIQAVLEVLESDLLTQGESGMFFEEALCNYYGSKFCSVVSNGTAALHLVGLALDWKKDY